MCGVVGLIGPNAIDKKNDILEAADILAHRGPDKTQVRASSDRKALLGMNTLAIISEDEEYGPYEDPNTGCIIAYNGEIYNFRELARKWNLHLSPCETDAHLVLRAYLAIGARCFTEFDGMFALAIYDPRERCVILARDPMGEKPLYYSVGPDSIFFASEVKAFPAAKRMTIDAPTEWLAIETLLGGRTPYAKISLLDPGTTARFTLDRPGMEATRYWNLRDLPRADPGGYAEASSRFTELLSNAVRSRVPDQPFGLMLSGGLDSAVLACLMRPDYLATVRYPGEAQFDEFENAQLVAKHLGTELICIEPQPADFLARAENLVSHMDYPMGNASVFSELMLYEAFSETGIRVVVGGIGPDELLLGYVRHSLLLDGPDGIAKAGLHTYSPMAEKFRLRAAGRQSAAERYLRLLLRGPDVSLEVRRRVYECFFAGRDVGQALTLSDLEVCFPSLQLTSDKLSSAYGLERRSPYLARELVEFCYSLPLQYKRSDAGRTKILLRDAARRIGVPQQIWDDRNKRGFASPLPTWLAGELSTWCRTRLERTACNPIAPPVVRRVAQNGLRLPPRRFDRTRLHALLMSLWWEGTPQESPQALVGPRWLNLESMATPTAEVGRL